MTRRLMSWCWLALAAPAWALAAGGCNPIVGDHCERGEAVCQDSQVLLACQQGRLTQVPCKGPKGCSTEGDRLHCDVSGNVAGDPCSTDDEGTGQCSADGSSVVTCEKGAWSTTPCRGARGCRMVADQSRCDTSVRQEGDRCVGDHHSCSTDGQSVLTCKDGKAVILKQCAEGQHCQKDTKTERIGCAG